MVCAAMGLCKSQQASLAKLHAQEQLTSNDIPQVDLSHQVAPFLLNVPGLLYPQNLEEKQEVPQQVHSRPSRSYLHSAVIRRMF